MTVVHLAAWNLTVPQTTPPPPRTPPPPTPVPPPLLLPLLHHLFPCLSGSCAGLLWRLRQEGRQWQSERMPAISEGMFGFCNSTLEMCDYKRDNFFNFLFCLDPAG